MSLSEFVANHCQGKQYDSCVESPCPFASHSGCRHPLHPNNAVEQNVHLTGLESAEQERIENEMSEWGNPSRNTAPQVM